MPVSSYSGGIVQEDPVLGQPREKDNEKPSQSITWVWWHPMLSCQLCGRHKCKDYDAGQPGKKCITLFEK
jgi:hypothetical protein